MQSECIRVFGSRNTVNMILHLKNEHDIDINELKRTIFRNSKRPSQATLDSMNLCPITPAAIENLKELLLKFGITRNVPALPMGSDKIIKCA